MIINEKTALSPRVMHLCAVRPRLAAGVISAPQSRLLARLVHLVEAKTVQEGVLEQQGVPDAVLMSGLLRPGQRSALFLHSSPRNDPFCQAVGEACYWLEAGHIPRLAGKAAMKRA